MKKKKLNNYIYGLDGLRALAIIGVTLFHVFPNTIKGGYLGVCLFFVITGFLLSVNSKKEFNIIQYFKKRILRIYPSLLIVVLVTCGICFFFSNDTLSGMKAEVLSIFGGYNNWWQISQNSDYFTKSFNNSPFTHFWFLGIELQYYVIWPILFIVYSIFSKRKEKSKAILFFIIVSIISVMWMSLGYKADVDVTPLYYGTHTRIFSLLLGSVLGFLYTSKKKKYNSNLILVKGITLLVEFLITICMYFMLDGQSAFLYRGGMFIMTLIFMHMVSIVTDRNLPYGKMLELPILKWISKYSFSIYLWQYPVIFFFSVFGWSDFPLNQVLEIAIILILAVWLERMIHFKKSRNRMMTIILTFCTFFFMVIGVYGIVRDDGRKELAIQEMQKQIEENEKAQEEAMKKKEKELAEKKKKEQKAQKEQAEKEEVKEESEEEKIAKLYTSEYCLTEDACMIGDSILLRSFKAIENLIPNSVINGAVSRQASSGIIVYDDLYTKGYVSQTVVICLGTNGGISRSESRTLLDTIGDKKDIFWVNNYVPTRSWMIPNNEILNELEEEYENLHIIDWVEICLEHPEYLGPDGIHPNAEGCAAYAQMIYDAITTTPHIKIEKKTEAA